MTAAIGLRAMKGGAIAVAITLDGGGGPRILLNTVLKASAEGDRLSFEPYAVAYELAADKDAAAAAVATGRERQDELAASGLRSLFSRIDGPVSAALLVNRAGWITDLLDYSLAFADHVPVAEGLAVREALRSAIRACAIDAVELDEKSLPQTATAALGLSAEAIDGRLKGLGTSAGKPWRKEQKLACLAAWVALVGIR